MDVAEQTKEVINERTTAQDACEKLNVSFLKACVYNIRYN